MNVILISVILLAVVGGVSALILYFVAQKFHVLEDARIDVVQEILPAANCGGCGYPGCRGFAEACVKADTLEGLYCPVGGSEVMSKVGSILGREAAQTVPMVAVVRCQGDCDKRPQTNEYDGPTNCSIATSLYGGDTDCSYGCLGHGDCVVVCGFDAIKMNPETRLPEVDEDKCTGCNACVKACPKVIIELRKKGPRSRRIYVGCVSKDKGAQTKNACAVGCIGCSKCFKVCEFDAITITNNLAYIDPNKCKLCRKCPEVCPTNAIVELNCPPRKKKEEDVISND
ncbi:MAG: Fe-S cluster domain-containing protein [Bacteroidales bacterium]|nr:Fe-S cluster domain-containing protein [Bacteroidales bacterium]